MKHRLTAASCLAVIAFGFVITESTAVLAQSGSRRGGKTMQRNQAQAGSAGRSGSRKASSKNLIALEGYCPVCIIDMKKWVRGVPQYQAKYDGKTYYFPGTEQQKVFLADPAKYVPALGGDCVVCLANAKKRVPGNIRLAAYHGNRLFLFPSSKPKKEFLTNREKYENVDLAIQGLCPVCRVEMGKDVPGKPEIAVVHNGMRYLFPAEKQRQMFLANPAKYVSEPSGKL